MNTGACFITWHYQSRSSNLAREMKIPIYEQQFDNPLLWRMVASSAWTIWLLIRRRPKTIFVQYSYLLLIILVLYKRARYSNVRIICDCHTKALRRLIRGPLRPVFVGIKKWSLQHVQMVIVSNDGLVAEARAWHSNVTVLSDPLPDVSCGANTVATEDYCVIVSSFASDEPIAELLQASRLLCEDIKVYWTGQPPDTLQKECAHVSNLVMTSYLPKAKYMALLEQATCLIVLTSEEDCLVSGGHEGLAHSVPLVLSNTPALRSYFGGAALYCDHSPLAIADTVRAAIHQRKELRERAGCIRSLRQKQFARALSDVTSQLNLDSP